MPLRLTYTNNIGTTANLVAWIHFNDNGLFDASERLSFWVPSAGSGSHTFTWTNIALNGPTVGDGTYASFLLTTDALTPSTPAGIAYNGEVEDYFIPFATSLPVTLSPFNKFSGGCSQQWHGPS